MLEALIIKASRCWLGAPGRNRRIHPHRKALILLTCAVVVRHLVRLLGQYPRDTLPLANGVSVHGGHGSGAGMPQELGHRRQGPPGVQQQRTGPVAKGMHLHVLQPGPFQRVVHGPSYGVFPDDAPLVMEYQGRLFRKMFPGCLRISYVI